MFSHLPTAEATGGAIGTWLLRGLLAGRCKDGASKLLFKPVGNVLPQGRDLGSRATFGIDFHNRSAVDHRCGEIGAVMQCDRCDRTVLRKGNGRFRSDLGFRGCGVDHENQGFARPFAEVDRSTDSAQVVRAGTGGDDDELCDGNDRLDRHGDRRRSVDNRKLEALLAQDRKVSGEPCDSRLGESGKLRFALVPPVGERSLRIDVDQDDRACARSLGLNGEMSRKRGLTRSALL